MASAVAARGGFVDVAADHPAAAPAKLDSEGRADAAARTGDDCRGIVTALVGRTEDAHDVNLPPGQRRCCGAILR